MSAVSMPVRVDVSDLVRTHQVELWRYLRFLGCDAQAAEDLAQDTFVAVLSKPFADRGPAARAAYVRRVARNLLLKSMRGAVRSPVELEEMEVSWQKFRGEDGGDAHVEALRTCVQQLRGRRRQIVELVYRQGRSLPEAADAMGMKVNGVRTLLQRLRQALRSCVTRRMGR